MTANVYKCQKYKCQKTFYKFLKCLWGIWTCRYSVSNQVGPPQLAMRHVSFSPRFDSSRPTIFPCITSLGDHPSLRPVCFFILFSWTLWHSPTRFPMPRRIDQTQSRESTRRQKRHASSLDWDPSSFFLLRFLLAPLACTHPVFERLRSPFIQFDFYFILFFIDCFLILLILDF